MAPADSIAGARAEAQANVFDYIGRFHNPRRVRKIEQRRKEEVN
jgi:hypothetical protein